MANKPLRPCKYPGCSQLVTAGYCPNHQPKRGKDSESYHHLYATREWKTQLRPGQLLREPFCRHCARDGKRMRATEVDHIVPHRGNMALFRDPGNLQSLCHQCHSRKTLSEIRQNRGEKT